MKLVYISFVIAVLVNGFNCDIIETGIDTNSLQEYVKYTQSLNQFKIRRLVEGICPGKWEDFQNVSKVVAECEKQFQQASLTVCDSLLKDLRQCSTPVIEFFEGCLPKESKYVPKFFFDTIISTADYFCGTDVQHLAEFFNPCLKTYNIRSNRCVRDMLQKLAVMKKNGVVPKKEVICETLDSYSNCAMNFVRSHCEHPLTRETYSTAFNAMLKVCKEP